MLVCPPPPKKGTDWKWEDLNNGNVSPSSGVGSQRWSCFLLRAEAGSVAGLALGSQKSILSVCYSKIPREGTNHREQDPPLVATLM